MVISDTQKYIQVCSFLLCFAALSPSISLMFVSSLYLCCSLDKGKLDSRQKVDIPSLILSWMQ